MPATEAEGQLHHYYKTPTRRKLSLYSVTANSLVAIVRREK
jgi:hypothetical protein